MITKPPINVQDSFFYQLRKDNTLVELELLGGKKISGRLRRFDKFALVFEAEGREVMIYKHAVASLAPVAPAALAAPKPGA